MSNPKFIAIDGIDGCGKGTQIELLKDRFKDADIPVWFTAEPTKGKIGRIIREDYLSGNVPAKHTIIDALYIADRIEHVASVGGIKYHLKSNEWVVSDRYVFSGITYIAANLFLDETNNIKSLPDAVEKAIEYSKIITDMQMPDLTIILDLPVSTAVRRINEGRSSKEIYENERFLQAVADTYKIAINGLSYFYPDSKFVTINADDFQDIIAMDVWEEIRNLLC